MTHPYLNLPENAFWKPAVGEREPLDIEGLWQPKFQVTPDDAVATFGSCFAQHIGKALKNRGYHWLNTEIAPHQLSPDQAKQFSYGIFTCRTGNIYTCSLLEQWTEWALRKRKVPQEIWRDGDRFYDPFRPRIEPNGFASAEEVRLAQRQTVMSFRRAIKRARFFVFTLGLTESWINTKAPMRVEYPMCPGTAAGHFDKNRHRFVNQSFAEVLKPLKSAIENMRSLNPDLKFILTVSPVPLAATASGNHVLTATMESKAILRAVAGQLARNNAHIDYFPSYEIISAPPYKGAFFEANGRSVTPEGVGHVMDQFFACQLATFGDAIDTAPKQSTKAAKARDPHSAENDVVCEEALLAAFGETP